jgi:hypothetical protein
MGKADETISYADLLSSVLVSEADWGAPDLEAITAHLLNTPFNEIIEDATCSDLLHELFSQPTPPIASLTLLKDYAKACRSNPDPPLPHPVATLLYYAVLAVALTKCGHLITQLDKASFVEGLRWAERCEWSPVQIAALARAAIPLVK